MGSDKEEKSGFPRLLMVDLDGTMLGGDFRPYTRIPDPVSAWLDWMDGKGCRWGINSTWGIGGQWDLVLNSGVKSRPAYLIGEMSLNLYEVKGDTPVGVEPYVGETAKELKAFNEKYFYPVLKRIMGRFSPAKMNFYGHWLDMTPLAEDVVGGKSGGVGDQVGGWEKFIEELKGEVGSLFHIDLQGEGKRLVMHPLFLDKKRAMVEVLKREGLKAGEVLIAGDARPDLKMMDGEVSRWAVVPGNAEEAVKEQVRKRDGGVGEAVAGLGVIEAFNKLAKKRGWAVYGG